MKIRPFTFIVTSFLLIIMESIGGFAQNNVGIGTVSPSPSARLEIADSTRGILIPRMNSAQRNAIASPAKGLLVFVTTDSSFYYFNGTGCQPLVSGTLLPSWSLAGNAGTSAPSNFLGTTDAQPLQFSYCPIHVSTIYLPSSLPIFNPVSLSVRK